MGEAMLRAVAGSAAAIAAALLLARKLRRASTVDVSEREPPVKNPGWLGGLKTIKDVVALDGDFGAYVYQVAKDGRVWKLNLWPFAPSLLIVNDIESVYTVNALESKMQLEMTLGAAYEGLHGPMDLQLLTGRTHKLWRKAFEAAFQPRILEATIPRYAVAFGEMWANLSKGSLQKPVVMRPAIREALLRVSADVFYGMKLEKGSSEMQQLDKDFADEEEGLFVSAINLPGFQYRRSKLAALRIRSAISKKLVTEIARSDGGPRAEAAISQSPGNAIEAFVRLRSSCDAEIREVLASVSGIVDNMLLLLEASQGTTNHTSTALLGLLHKDCNRACLERLREEAMTSNWACEEGRPTLADLEGWKYADACIDETMRLFPVGGGKTMKLREGQELELCGSVVRGPQSFLVNWGYQYSNPTLFPRPDEFVPERWMEDGPDGVRAGSEARRAFLPFGLGSHVCVGKKYARLIMKLLLLAYIKGGYRIELAGPVERKPGNIFPQYLVGNGLVVRVLA